MVSPTSWTYTLSLHDALPILCEQHPPGRGHGARYDFGAARAPFSPVAGSWRSSSIDREPVRGRRSTPTTLFKKHRSEEHTSELQSRENLVCRLLLEKKKSTMN